MTTQSLTDSEDDAFITGRAKPKSKCQAFCDFLYNKQDGTVLGRTGKSWLEISAFYVIFYACLAGFFAICLAVFVSTLNSQTPTFYGKGSIIGINPGLGYQPWLRSDAESTLVYFDEHNPETYEEYVKQLDSFFKKYDNVNFTRKCNDDDPNTWPKHDNDAACHFSKAEFPSECTRDSYGFAIGKPCVALSLNRLVDWLPIAYPEGSVPDEVKDKYVPDNVAVDCDGAYFADKDNIGHRTYFPKSGFSRKYFPYRRFKNYHSPLVFVQFKSLPVGAVIFVECKAYAYNIIHDKEDRLGMVRFELLRDQGAPKKND